MKTPPAEDDPPAARSGTKDKGLVTAEWHGPLPPPSILRDFDDVVENGAERIMQAWEKETEHRHRLESRDLWLTGIDAIFGKLAALVFVLAALALTAYAISMGSEWVAVVLGSGVIGSVAWAFVSNAKGNRPGK